MTAVDDRDLKTRSDPPPAPLEGWPVVILLVPLLREPVLDEAALLLKTHGLDSATFLGRDFREQPLEILFESQPNREDHLRRLAPQRRRPPRCAASGLG